MALINKHQCPGAVCGKRVYLGPCEVCRRLLVDAPEYPEHPARRMSTAQVIHTDMLGGMTLLDAKLRELEAIDEEYVAKVRAFNAATRAAYDKLVVLAVAAFGIANEVTRKIRRAAPRSIQEQRPGAILRAQAEKVIRDALESRARAREERARAVLDRALALLHKYEIVAPASAVEAVALANSTHRAKLIEAATPREGEFVDFADHNCNDWRDEDDERDPCPGWDGKSQKCECGNRRVCWDDDGELDQMYVYARAH